MSTSALAKIMGNAVTSMAAHAASTIILQVLRMALFGRAQVAESTVARIYDIVQ
jgi:hypothetical protein